MSKGWRFQELVNYLTLHLIPYTLHPAFKVMSKGWRFQELVNYLKGSHNAQALGCQIVCVHLVAQYTTLFLKNRVAKSKMGENLLFRLIVWTSKRSKVTSISICQLLNLANNFENLLFLPPFHPIKEWKRIKFKISATLCNTSHIVLCLISIILLYDLW